MLRLWKALWVRIRTWITRLLRRPDRLERRLRRLRAIYATDPDAGLHTRRVRDVLRGEVAPDYHPYYDRLLRIEQSITELLRNDVPPALRTSDLTGHVQTLTERVARLLDQVQRCDVLGVLYVDKPLEHAKIMDARQHLMERIEESIALQESIPVSVLQLATTAASTGRNFSRLRDTLDDLKARLQDITESYTELETPAIDILKMSLEEQQPDQIEQDHFKEQNKTS